MRISIITLAFCLTILTSNVQSPYNTGFLLKCEISGLLDSTVVYFVRNKESRDGVDTIDRTISKGGLFKFKGVAPYEGEEYFIFIDHSRYPRKFPRILVLLENKAAELKTSVDDLMTSKRQSDVTQRVLITGFPGHADFVSYNMGQRKLLDSLNGLRAKIRELNGEGDRAEILAEIKKLDRLSLNYRLTWIDSHSNSFVTPWLILNGTNNFSNDEMKNMYLKLTERVRQSKWGLLLNERITTEERVGIGRIAPSFTFPTIDGQNLSLKDVVSRNKLTLVDFWASWCGPCRASFPELIDLYSKYKSQGLEIIGFSTDIDNADSAWRATIAQYNLPWIQVRETTKNYANEVYDIKRLPETYLLDNEGRIIAKGLYGVELESTISEILNN